MQISLWEIKITWRICNKLDEEKNGYVARSITICDIVKSISTRSNQGSGID